MLALLALTAALVLCAPAVFAEDGTSTEPKTVDYTGVAAQLEAVARSEGKAMAQNMLTAAFTAVSPEIAEPEPMSAEPAAAPVSSSDGPAVVVHARAESWSLSGVLPFFLVVAVAMSGALFALYALRRGRVHMHRPVYARSYRPQRDLVFREETFEKRSAWRLNR